MNDVVYNCWSGPNNEQLNDKFQNKSQLDMQALNNISFVEQYIIFLEDLAGDKLS